MEIRGQVCGANLLCLPLIRIQGLNLCLQASFSSYAICRHLACSVHICFRMWSKDGHYLILSDFGICVIDSGRFLLSLSGQWCDRNPESSAQGEFHALLYELYH